MTTFKVGDEVALRDSHYRTSAHIVAKVSPAGYIVTLDNGRQFDREGWARGRGPYGRARITPMGEAARAEIAADDAASRALVALETIRGIVVKRSGWRRVLGPVELMALAYQLEAIVGGLKNDQA